MKNSAIYITESLVRFVENADSPDNQKSLELPLAGRKKEEIALEIHGKGDCQLEIWGVQTHAEDFEDVFGKKMVIETVLQND